MTDQGQEKDEITFSEEQQKLFNKRIGEARVKARELAKTEFETAAKQETADAERESMAAAAEWEKLAKHHEDRVTELEPFEAEAAAYRELITGMLKDKVKALGEVAKKAVGALPEGLSDLDRLNWLNANQELFETDARRVLGTPARKVKRAAGRPERPEGYRRTRLS